MNAVELFAGCGGFARGLHGTGVNVVAAYELDSANCEIYPKITGHSCQQTDLTTMLLDELPDCDLIFGGPPCQDFSGAGKGEGKDGNRNLWPVAIKAVEVKRPGMFIYENVKGLNQGKHKPYFQEILKTFRDMGYTVDWRLLNAADYGVPQTRERIFIVGRRDGLPICWPEPTHWNRPTGLFYRRWISWGEALKDWFSSAQVLNSPMPNWLLKRYGDNFPATGMFDGHAKGNVKTKQHREMHEPSYTIVKSNQKSLVRLKVNDTIYRLDEKGSAILQTIPYIPGLKVWQIGNSVAPLQVAALFKALIGEVSGLPMAA